MRGRAAIIHHYTTFLCAEQESKRLASKDVFFLKQGSVIQRCREPPEL